MGQVRGPFSTHDARDASPTDCRPAAKQSGKNRFAGAKQAGASEEELREATFIAMRQAAARLRTLAEEVTGFEPGK